MRYLVLLLFYLSACDYVAPSTSKALTEKDQLEQLKKQNELLEQQNVILLRIALSLEERTHITEQPVKQKKDVRTFLLEANK